MENYQKRKLMEKAYVLRYGSVKNKTYQYIAQKLEVDVKPQTISRWVKKIEAEKINATPTEKKKRTENLLYHVQTGEKYGEPINEFLSTQSDRSNWSSGIKLMKKQYLKMSDDGSYKINTHIYVIDDDIDRKLFLERMNDRYDSIFKIYRWHVIILYRGEYADLMKGKTIRSGKSRLRRVRGKIKSVK